MDWNAIIIAIIENGLWPFVILVIALLAAFFSDFSKIIESIKSLKVGSFSIETREAAKKVDAFAEYESLSSLTYGQLHLFLVIGGEGGEATEFRNKMNPAEFSEGFKKLNDLGLIDYQVKPEGTFFGNTKKGKALHKIIMDNLYHQLNA